MNAPHRTSRRCARRTWHRVWHRLVRTAMVALAGLFAGAAAAQETRVAALGELATLSLEELGRIEITSVARRPEPLRDAAASIYVITAEDIRRSGVTSLPEALRLAPNLEVARANSAQYAISARGFKDALGNKLLVLMDGRTIYSPLFAGVFWDAQDAVLEDIDRIEVISGPGGTLWGSNAVNGVINIITRPSERTQGVLVSAGAGDAERGVVARRGGALASGGHYRVYVKRFDREGLAFADGRAAGDDTDKTQAGFRTDWGNAASFFTVQGDVYQGDTGNRAGADTQIGGANLLLRWSSSAADGSSSRLQAYYDRTRRHDAAIRDEMQTLDLEYQHGWKATAAQQVLWGAGYRLAEDRIETGPVVFFLPPEQKLRWSHLFIQDTLAFGDHLNLTLGAKWETNTYTGTEFLPSARIDWRPQGRGLLWSALSRAVRAPSRIDRDFSIPLLGIVGGPNFQSEVSDVFELGYRSRATDAVSFSVTAFHHEHDKLRSGQPGAGGFEVVNLIEGHTQGLEGWAAWQASPAWRLSAGFLQLHQHLRLKPGSLDPTGPTALGNDPEYQVQLRSALALAGGHELDVMVRHVDELPQPAVPAHTAVDLRWGWRVHRDVEVSLALQNLFDPSHLESGDAAGGGYVGRSAFLKLVWRP